MILGRWMWEEEDAREKEERMKDHKPSTVTEMANNLTVFLLFSTLLAVANSLNCTSQCIQDRCPFPVDCFAGIIKDPCGCCLVCGQREGYRCYDEKLEGKIDPSFRQNGACGENLECRIRDDLASDEPTEALCYCVRKDMICGTDGNTYDNICHLTEARFKRRDGLTAAYTGPCRSAPKILIKPRDSNTTIGSKLAFMCEVSGWPVPRVSWKVMRKHSHKIHFINDLPSDDSHIVVQSRGGAKNLEVTSWLKIVGVREDDEGEYHCMASNDMGEDMNYAILKITKTVAQSKERPHAKKQKPTRKTE